MVSIAGRLRAAVVVAFASSGLVACQTDGSGFASLTGSVPSTEKIEAPGVPIALERIEGVPDSARAGLDEAIASEADARKIELVSTRGSARYRVRGYLSAFEDENGGTTLSFVWDVFDTAKRRSRRIEGAQIAKGGAGGDPWSAVDQTALGKVASQSMNEIAGFLVANGGSETQVASVE